MGYKTLAEIKGVDLIIGESGQNVCTRLRQHMGKNEEPLIIRDRIVKEDFTIETTQSDSKTRANLKIQDGCDFMCTFCIIPMARGRPAPAIWTICSKKHLHSLARAFAKSLSLV